MTSSSSTRSSSESDESSSAYVRLGDGWALRARGLPGAEESFARWRGRVDGLLVSESGPDEVALETGLGRRMVNDTLVDMMAVATSKWGSKSSQGGATYLLTATMLRTCTRSIRLQRSFLPAILASNHTRSFKSSSPFTSALASHPTAHPTVVVLPRHIEQEELDVDLIPPQDINIELTDRAAEVTPSSSSLAS